MVKRYATIWVSEEIHHLAKSKASMKGLKLSEYVGLRIKEDHSVVQNGIDDLKEELEQKRGRKFGFHFK